MQWKSHAAGYGIVAVTVHWISAIAIAVLFASGFLSANGTDPATKLALLRLHVPLAIVTVVLTLSRAAWWYFVDSKPGKVPGSVPWQNLMAANVHRLIYVVILVMGASGLATIVISGAGPILFGSSHQALPNFLNFAPRRAHGVGAFVLLAVVAIHIGAAFYHHFVKRDGLLRRIGIKWLR